jgi:hypothetical protein
LGAKVTVESDAGGTYPLAEAGKGNYVAVGLNLNTANKYRLDITTSDGKIYQSDFVPVKSSQPIDSVSYQVQNNNAVQISVSTHDPSNSSQYYRWFYNETWIIHAKYESSLMLQTVPKDTVVYRDPAHQIFRCWLSDVSSDIVLGSTAKLAKDILVNSPVAILPSTSEKFTERYSILVKQYALTTDAYNYYVQLRKNTEQLGSIFDPQPSELTGNIHCISNPAEKVIGYITAGVPAQQRIYINADQLPVGPNWIPNTPYNDCSFDTSLFFNPKTKQNEVEANIYSGFEIPILTVGNPGQPPLGYTGSSGECVDCTVRGPSKPPSFWTNE